MTVAAHIVALVVDANFITACASSAQAFKTATLLKTLNVNALITGEIGVGKKSLSKYILPNADIISASSHDELLIALQSVNKIIISDIELSPNIKKVLEIASDNNIRVIATAKSYFTNDFVDKFFSIKFEIPPLAQRPDDVNELIKKFTKEAALLFGSNNKFKINNFKPDLSQNSNSLRRQVMIYYLLQDINEQELMNIIESYLSDKIGSNSDYKNLIYLYEAPLIKAGLNKFKSQLQLSDKLGLNRNTLRKKIAENAKYL